MTGAQKFLTVVISEKIRDIAERSVRRIRQSEHNDAATADRFPRRMGWSQGELARRLELSPSRISDYEKGETRTKPPRDRRRSRSGSSLPVRGSEGHARLLTPQEKSALLHDTRHLPHPEGPPSDVSRAAIYSERPRDL